MGYYVHFLRESATQSSHILGSPWEPSNQVVALVVIALELAAKELHQHCSFYVLLFFALELLGKVATHGFLFELIHRPEFESELPC